MEDRALRGGLIRAHAARLAAAMGFGVGHMAADMLGERPPPLFMPSPTLTPYGAFYEKPRRIPMGTVQRHGDKKKRQNRLRTARRVRAKHRRAG